MATSRVVLAAVFLAAAALAASRPPHVGNTGAVLLAIYLCWAKVLATITWRSWWWDFRLAKTVHAIDIAVFIAAVFATETGTGDFGSPFLGFIAFLLTMGTVRWAQRGAVRTAWVLIICYSLTGLALILLGYGVDPYMLTRRLLYMIAVSLMVIWLGAGERVARLETIPDPGGIPGKRQVQVLAAALCYARRMLNARGAAIAVIQYEEPWIDLYRDDDGVFVHERIGPDALGDDFGPDNDAALFDVVNQRRIQLFGDQRLQPVSGPFQYALAEACQVSGGLLARMTSASCHGQLLVWGMADASFDDLPVIAAMAREVGFALDREEMALLAQSIAVAGVRNALARDLHDSVVQFLAGTLFRLEALRRWIHEGRDPDAEILAMREALRREQGELRAMIDRLRRGLDGDRATDIVAELDVLMTEMGRHWHIATSLSATSRPLPVSINLAHELRQLVREAVANAVRHGECNRVDLALERGHDGSLQIAIGDNGKGFPPTSSGIRPRSIGERVDALGGNLRISTGSSGVKLEIELPTAA